MEVCISFTAGYSEAGDRHEVCCDLVFIVERLPVGVFGSGRVFGGLNEGWSSGTISGSVSWKFERGRQVARLFGEGKRPVPSVTFLDSGVFKLLS